MQTVESPPTIEGASSAVIWWHSELPSNRRQIISKASWAKVPHSMGSRPATKVTHLASSTTSENIDALQAAVYFTNRAS